MSIASRSVQPAIHFRDAAFDPAHCERFCLVTEAGGNHFALAVLDNLTNDFLAFEKYTFPKVKDESGLAAEIEKLSEEHEWLTNGFKRTDAMVVSERFTLVPAALFDSTHTKDYIRFNQPVSENDVVLNDLLRNADARNIYAIDASLEKALKKISSTVRIRHHFTPLIERTLAVNKNKTGRRAFAHVQEQRFDLIISEGGKLLLANTFSCTTSEDFIYYLLFTCEQLKMNPEEAHVEIAGETETDSAIAGMAKKYLRHVTFAGHPVDARFAKEFDRFPPHFYFNLFSLHYYS